VKGFRVIQNVFVSGEKMDDKIGLLILIILYGFIFIAGIKFLVFMFKKQ